LEVSRCGERQFGSNLGRAGRFLESALPLRFIMAGRRLERAIRLCEATYGHMFTYDGELFHLAAISGPPGYVEWSSHLGPVRWGPSAPLGRISRGERIVHVTDVQEAGESRRIAVVSAAKLQSRCSKTTYYSAQWLSTAKRCARSPTSRSRSC